MPLFLCKDVLFAIYVTVNTVRASLFHVFDMSYMCDVTNFMLVDKFTQMSSENRTWVSQVNVVNDEGPLREMVADGASPHVCGKLLCHIFGRNERSFTVCIRCCLSSCFFMGEWPFWSTHCFKFVAKKIKKTNNQKCIALKTCCGTITVTATMFDAIIYSAFCLWLLPVFKDNIDLRL